MTSCLGTLTNYGSGGPDLQGSLQPGELTKTPQDFGCALLHIYEQDVADKNTDTDTDIYQILVLPGCK